MAVWVDLSFGVDGARRLAFAALKGADERDCDGGDALLARLAVPGAQAVHGAAIAALTVGDRDRALAALHASLYGDAIAADTVCAECGARYEMRFDLADLVASRQPDGSASGTPPAVAVAGSTVRLPRWSDIAGSPADLLARLTLSGPVPDTETADPALEAGDPPLELDLAGTCPECAARQAVPFSMAAFLDAALRRDRAFLAREVHLIASAYHWSQAEILSLTRAERQGYARLLIAERDAGAVQLRRVA